MSDMENIQVDQEGEHAAGCRQAHLHGHDAAHASGQGSGQASSDGMILTLRPHTGIAGDMLLAGLASIALEELRISPVSPEAAQWLGQLGGSIMPELANAVRLRKKQVNGISGLQAHVNLPPQHAHRSLEDIQRIIGQAGISERAKQLAAACFELLAANEAAVHDVEPGLIHFHEVGALDSILDICAVCEIYVRLREPALVCGALPLADGDINCAHGSIPAPAPAVLRMLPGVLARPFAGESQAGELVTPTGIALLRTLNASFGQWPQFRIAYVAMVYGQKVFANVANGLIVAMGRLEPYD